MKKIYVAKRVGLYEIIDISVSDSVEEAERDARFDRNHLTYREQAKCQHFVYAYKAPDDVNDMESFTDWQEQDYCDPFDCWIIYTKGELVDLSDNINWDITSKKDLLDSLRNNWIYQLTESEVSLLYELMVVNEEYAD